MEKTLSNSSNLYSSHFWQNYKVIYEHYYKKQKEIMDVFYIFNKLFSLIQELSNGLKNISEYPFSFDNNSTFGKGMNNFIDLIVKESEIFYQFSEKIEKMLSIINDTMTTAVYMARDNVKERAKKLNEFIVSLNENENYKLDYYNKVRNALKFKLKLDEKNKKDLDELKTLISLAKNARESYKNNIKYCNTKRIEYISAISTGLYTFEDKEKLIINNSKSLIIDYLNSKINLFQNQINSLKEKIELNFNSINSELDMKNFVNENNSLGSQPIEISFIEYSIDFNIESINAQDRNRKVTILKDFLYNTFKCLDENLQETKNIKEKCEDIWFSRFKKENINLLLSLLSENGKGEKMDKKNCLYFLNYFNLMRTTGQYLIENDSFDCIVKCLNYILDLNNINLMKDDIPICDFEICGLCIIISQTYCKNGPEKEFIQTGIENNSIFKNKDFWFDLASYYIQTNYNEHMKGADCIQELDEEDTTKIKTVAFGKISTILYNMKNFHVEIKIVKELSEKLCKQFDIEKEVINQIWNINQKNENEFELIFDNDEKKDEKIDNQNQNQFNFEKEMKEGEDIINKNKNKEENEDEEENEDDD